METEPSFKQLATAFLAAGCPGASEEGHYQAEMLTGLPFQYLTEDVALRVARRDLETRKAIDLIYRWSSTSLGSYPLRPVGAVPAPRSGAIALQNIWNAMSRTSLEGRVKAGDCSVPPLASSHATALEAARSPQDAASSARTV